MVSRQAIVAILLALGTIILLGQLHQDPGTAQTAAGSRSVLQHHNDPARSGRYVDPAFTRQNVARLHRDPALHGALTGPVYAQPLYWAEDGRAKARLLVATEQNNVYALDATTGAVLWRRTLGAPVPRRSLPCGNIDPLGITGTPIIDPASRTLFVDAMVTPDGGATKRHLIAGLSIDDGTMRAGWPVDTSRIRAGALTFTAATENQRGALALLGGVLYVPYGGHYGDCGDYHGWVVGVPIADPTRPRAWATRARGDGIWAPGGIASDGQALYVATGNTMNAASWSDGEAVIRLRPGPAFSGQPADFFAPTNWQYLDSTDRDLGGSAPLLVHVAGAVPADLVVALGKNGIAYLLDRARMGGIGGELFAQRVATPIITAGASYTTGRGTYVVFKGAGIGCAGGRSGSLVALRIEPSPVRLGVAWCADQHGLGSPIVTTTDGRSDPIVWSIGAEGDNRLHAFDADSGEVIFDGGGAGEAMSSVRRYQTPIVADGRILVATDDGVVAFAPGP